MQDLLNMKNENTFNLIKLSHINQLPIKYCTVTNVADY